jgi:AcrR family transcriptional regulator
MKSEERRAAIVRAAIHLFAEKGFRGATTRALASELGVTEPVLYQHFATKSALYAAIIEMKAAEASQDASKLRQLAAAGDDAGFLRALSDTILERYENDAELTRLLLFSCLERHELSELFFERLVQDFYRLVAGYIRRRIRAGAFREVNPEIAARCLVGMVAYQGLMALLFPGRVPTPNRQRVVEEITTLFLNGILAAPA